MLRFLHPFRFPFIVFRKRNLETILFYLPSTYANWNYKSHIHFTTFFAQG